MATTGLTRDRVAAKQGTHAERQQARMARTAYLYILPAALLMLLITFWPLIYQLWMSFTNYSNRNLRTDNLILQMTGSFTGNPQYNSPEFIGLANYVGILFGDLASVLSGFDFWRILTFNLVWTAVNLVFHVAIGVGVAVLLNQEGFRGKRFYRAFYIIPWAMPALVSAMIWRNMFDDQSGAVNQLLASLGLPSGPRWLLEVNPPFPWIPPIIQVPGWANPFLFLFLFLVIFIIPYFFKWVRERWLKFTILWAIALEVIFLFVLTPVLNLFSGVFASPIGAAAPNIVLGLGALFPLSFFAVLVANIWLGWPFMMAVATGALQSIPKDMYEAAEIDGANSWQSFWGVTVPLIRPAMIPAIIIGLTLTFNQFSVFYFISGGGPLHSTEILVTQAYRLVNEVTINIPGVGNVRPYGYAAAFAYIVFAVLATITLITNRVSRATQAAAD